MSDIVERLTEDAEYIDNYDWFVGAPGRIGITIKLAAIEILALRARVAELEAGREWRDIATAPKDGTDVLVCSADGGFPPLVAFWSEDAEDLLNSWDFTDKVEWATHWTSILPAPPPGGQ